MQIYIIIIIIILIIILINNKNINEEKYLLTPKFNTKKDQKNIDNFNIYNKNNYENRKLGI